VVVALHISSTRYIWNPFFQPILVE